uniref:Uncharacterized protein n=1 Tax=Psilocybe cubensis TaxID=181762 RepID=A0A8H8CMT1_PSICU
MAHQAESASWLDPVSHSPVFDSITLQVNAEQEWHGTDEVIVASDQVEGNLQRVDRVSTRDQTSILQSATDFDIHGGTFSTIAGDSYTANRDMHLTINNHIHSLASNEAREAIDTGEIYEASMKPMPQPPSLPVQRSCDIYRRHMAAKGRGIPLWIPEPNKNLPLQYQRQGIAIGDVGVMTASGGFAFLFNICLAHDHPINPPTLPVNFKPIQVAALNIHCHSEFKNNSYLASASTVRSQNDGDASGLVFESSASNGAILTMPLGSKSEDLGSIGRFRRYVAANMLHWYNYAYHDREYDVRNGDLRLVIGCDKTSSWGMATFANSAAHQESFHLKFGLIEGRRYGWEYSGTAEVRVGPDAHEIAQLWDNDPSQHNITYENQCLFIRTINATLPDDIWVNLGFDYSELDLVVESQLPDGSSTPALTDANLKSRVSTGLPKTTSFLNREGANYADLGANHNILTVHGTRTIYSSSPFLNDHPSKAINAMLLKNSSKEVKMAITQDQDWISVMTEEDAVMPTSEDFLARIRESFDICEEDGVVYLENAQGKYKIVHDDTTDADLLPESIPDSAQLVDTTTGKFSGTPTGDNLDFLEDIRNVITPEDVPSFYNSVTILKSTYRNIERLKIYKQKCKVISDKCFELMKALVDGSQGIEGAVISDVVEEVEGIVSQFERSLGEWASWNRLRSILRQREIRDRIYQLHRNMEEAVSKLHINLDMIRNAGDAQAIQQQEKSEIRNVLRSIVKSSEDIKTLLSMQSLPGSHAVEEIMERLQTTGD